MNFKLISILLLIILLTSCSYRECDIFSSCFNLKESMVNFYESPNDSYVKGNHFQAKIIDINKVNYRFYNKDATAYIMYIAIAPLCNNKISINSIQPLYKFDEMKNYMKNNGLDFYYRGLSLFDKYIEFNKPLTFNDVSEFESLVIPISIRNGNNELQSANNILNKEFEKYATSLIFEIKYNNGHIEYLNIENQNKINEYNNIDEIPNNRKDLIAYYKNNDFNNRIYGYFRKDVLLNMINP